MPANPAALTHALMPVLGLSLLATTPTAAAQSALRTADRIEEIRITALALDEDADKIIAPFTVLDGSALLRRGGSLGDLLDGLPGLHSDNFGGGASRPVIRGQTAPRLRVLADGAALLDASDISPDHAVTADPLLAQRIEVLRGPATLLYGGNAMGGVINVLDDKVPTALPEGLEGRFALRGNSVAREKAGAAAATVRATDSLALHVEASRREGEDYRSPAGRVAGSWLENRNASLGAAWIGERGYLGLAWSQRDDDYGVPGHAHAYESCHPHGSLLHCGGHGEEEEDHDHDHGHGPEIAPRIDLDSRRLDLRGELLEPFTGIHRLRLRASHSDYEHQEMEEDQPGTRFTNKGFEGRLEVEHAALLGLRGVLGVQLSDTRFSAVGAEAFIPETDSRSIALFAIEHYQLTENWHVEAGLRHEEVTHEPRRDTRGRPAFEDSASSFSGALIWSLGERHALALSYAHAERLPHPQELYARGIHLATNSYECGLVPHPLTCGGAENNAGLGKETARNVELSLRRQAGRLTYELNLYRNEIDDYIYARTLDRFEDFRLLKYSQRDARFSGGEAELAFQFSDALSLSLFADQVRARFADGSRLPRIPPRRLGGRMQFDLRGFGAELEYYRASRQDEVAEHERPTPGYDMLNLSLSFSPAGQPATTFFLRGSNLLDEEVHSHASFLAGVVPLPGRNLSAGVSHSF